MSNIDQSKSRQLVEQRQASCKIGVPNPSVNQPEPAREDCGASVRRFIGKQGVIAVYLNRGIAYSNMGIYTDGMKLSAWAKANGLAYQTAWRMWRAGKLPIPAEQLPTGTVIVHPPKAPTVESVAIDARVSSADQKGDLERQLGISRSSNVCPDL